MATCPPWRWSEGDLTVVHARPDDFWRAPTANASDDDPTSTYGSLGTDHVVYAHIHSPYIRHLNSLTVANSGAVSLSYDGDRRAAYVVIDRGHITIRRVEYDIEREVHVLVSRQCPDARWLADMLRAGTPLPPPTPSSG